MVRVLRVLCDAIGDRDDHAATLAEIDRQSEAVIEDARRAGLL